MPAEVAPGGTRGLNAGRREPAAFWSGDGGVALAVFFVALLVYFANAASLLPPESDSVPNAFLAASVLEDGDLAYSPFEAPFMFVWSAKKDERDVVVHVLNWNQVPPGSEKPWSEHYQEGRLQFLRPKYYLVPTLRERASTGEPMFVSAFGPMAGLTAIPLAAVARLAGARLYEDTAATWM